MILLNIFVYSSLVVVALAMKEWSFYIGFFYVIYTLFLNQDLKKRIFIFPPTCICYGFLLFFLLPPLFYQDFFLFRIPNFHTSVQIATCSALAFTIGSYLVKFFNQSCWFTYCYSPFDYVFKFSRRFIEWFSLSISLTYFLLLVSGTRLDVTNYLNKVSFIGILLLLLSYISWVLIFLLMHLVFAIGNASNLERISLVFLLLTRILTFSKGYILQVILIGFFYSMHRAKMATKLKVLLASIPLAFLFSFFINTSYAIRSGISDYSFGFESIMGTFNVLLARGNLVEPFARSLSKLPSESISSFLSTLPGGNSIFPFSLLVLIPKFLYTDRISSSIGGEIGTILGYTKYSDITEVTMSLPAEIFHNLGQFYLLFWIFYGYLTTYFFARILQNKSVFSFSICCYFAFQLLIFGFESYFALRLSASIKFALAVILLFLFIPRSRAKPFAIH